jgi:tRNA-dihydrouridine synthase B
MAEQIKIGPHTLNGRVILAPMAGLTDQVFRNICRSFGAALAVSEMSTADTRLWNSRKSETRLDLAGDNGIKVLQIAGSEPAQLANAARAAVDLGADIIDINMGCPAKKVCRKLSGSALLQDENLVARILEAVVDASALPVTLKMRTGWNPVNRNGARIAKLAEQIGVAALAIHGRTRECMFKGDAEFETIRQIKQSVSIPVFANGDITDINRAKEILEYTGADAVMIGRGALGRPWIFRQLNSTLSQELADEESGQKTTRLPVSPSEQRATILLHLNELHRLYGKERGVRVGRKHLTWYCKYLDGAEEFRNRIVRIDNAETQLQLTEEFLGQTYSPEEGAEKPALEADTLSSGKEHFQKESGRLRQENRS